MTANRTNSGSNLLRIVILCSSLLLANGLLQWLVDQDLGFSCWTHNVLRNWEDYGWGTLKGQMVMNPGGHEVLTQPEVYPGHRATSMYPVYFIGRLFARTGWHTLPYHVFMCLAVLLSVWHLLGKTEKALALAGVVVLCPGYLVWPTSLDPNSNATLAGFPYIALLFWRLRQPRLRVTDVLVLLGLTAAFTALNWTTVLVHAQIFACLLVWRQAGWRRVGAYTVASAIAGGLVLLASVRSKTAGGEHGVGGLLQFLSSYTWGSGGYGHGTNTLTLLVRVTFVNLVALLPLWLLWGWDWLRLARRDLPRAVWCLLPLLVTVLEIVGMRNYFCHHPWMAAPQLLVGVVLCWFLVKASAPASQETPAPVSAPAARWLGWRSAGALAAAFVFCLLVLQFYRENQATSFSLVTFLRHHTARGDAIVLVRGNDPAAAEDSERMGEVYDRWFVVVEQLPEPQPDAQGAFVLSSVPLDARWPLVGKCTGDSQASVPLLRSGLEWFRRNISRRKAGDRMALATTFYLYRAPAELAVKAAVKRQAATSGSPTS